MKKTEYVKEEIRQHMDDIRIVDTHEHLGFSLANVRIPQLEGLQLDLPFFLSRPLDLKKFEYLKKPFSEDRSEIRWNELKSQLDDFRNTISHRLLLKAFLNLYDFNEDEINDSNWKKLSLSIREKSRNRLEWSLEVLDRMNIYKIILDNKTWLPNDEIIKDDRLVQGVKMDQFIHGWTNLQVAGVSKEKIHSLDAYLNILDKAFETTIKAGAVGIKSVMAASRILFFDDVSKSDAEKVFLKGLGNASSRERKMFQDFMMHKVCERCAEFNLPFQIHTGLQAGGKNIITNSKPTHLTNLFQKFSDVRFIIFHGGYPYTQEAGIMAKYFPNVYVSGCWLDTISPAAYKRALNEWLEILPANKIFAWGGDQGIIDMSYSSLILAKELVSEVLADKVVSGYFSKKNALYVAEKIMGENAIEIFSL